METKPLLIEFCATMDHNHHYSTHQNNHQHHRPPPGGTPPPARHHLPPNHHHPPRHPPLSPSVSPPSSSNCAQFQPPSHHHHQPHQAVPFPVVLPGSSGIGGGGGGQPCGTAEKPPVGNEEWRESDPHLHNTSRRGRGGMNKTGTAGEGRSEVNISPRSPRHLNNYNNNTIARNSRRRRRDSSTDEPNLDSDSGRNKNQTNTSADISDPRRRMRRRELSQFAPEEADRILRRRERNKVAATKCRHKRHAQHEHLVKELQTMECENTSLTYEIRQLQRQRQALSDVLRHHQMSCTTHLQVNLTADPLAVDTKTLSPSGLPGPYPLPYTR